MRILDHGYVELVGWYGKEEDIISAARMSTGGDFRGWETDSRLLEYLYRNKHLSPFEMGDMTIQVQAPIFVAREWMRHRTQSFNEFSGRYSVMPDLWYVPSEVRAQGKSKQGSDGIISDPWFRDVVEGSSENLQDKYQEAVSSGVAKEMARIILPVNRYTRFRAKANLRNWLHFLELRLHESSQWEIRQYAEGVASLVSELWPRTFALFRKHTLETVTIAKEEYELLRAKSPTP